MGTITVDYAITTGTASSAPDVPVDVTLTPSPTLTAYLTPAGVITADLTPPATLTADLTGPVATLTADLGNLAPYGVQVVVDFAAPVLLGPGEVYDIFTRTQVPFHRPITLSAGALIRAAANSFLVSV